MEFFRLFFYFFVGIVLFLILNYVDKKKVNDFEYVFVGILVMLICSLVMDFFDWNYDNVFLVIVLEFLMRVFYDFGVLGKNFFKGSRVRTYFWLLLIGGCVEFCFIRRVDRIFLTGSELRLVIWGFVLWLGLDRLLKRDVFVSNKRKYLSFCDDREYIVMQYARYKNMYSGVVSSKYLDVKRIVYAVMVYNGYYKPSLVRWFDKFKFKFCDGRMRFGIMQVISDKIITDEESIFMGMKRLDKIYKDVSVKKNVCDKDNVLMVLKKYCDDELNCDEIKKICDIIGEFEDK